MLLWPEVPWPNPGLLQGCTLGQRACSGPNTTPSLEEKKMYCLIYNPRLWTRSIRSRFGMKVVPLRQIHALMSHPVKPISGLDSISRSWLHSDWYKKNNKTFWTMDGVTTKIKSKHRLAWWCHAMETLSALVVFCGGATGYYQWVSLVGTNPPDIERFQHY